MTDFLSLYYYQDPFTCQVGFPNHKKSAGYKTRTFFIEFRNNFKKVRIFINLIMTPEFIILAVMTNNCT